MKVSFLVTYYNQEQYVRQSLDSILAIEKACDWEILIGDDGSSDGTVGIVQKYIDRDSEHIHLYIMPRDPERTYDPVRRASENRLNLLEHCTGDCFCILDGDDFYMDTSFVPDAVQVMEAHSEVSFVAFGYSYFRDGAYEEKLLPVAGDQLLDTEAFLRSMYTPGGAGVHRLSWGKERIEFIRKLGSFDDQDLFMNSLHYGGIWYISRSIYAYRQVGESIYSRMKMMERAVLNVWGMDIALELTHRAWPDALLERYGYSVILMYANRKRLRERLGEEKFRRYLESSERLKESVCHDLLVYDQLGSDDKKRVRNLTYAAMKGKKSGAMKIMIKSMFGAYQ